MAAALVPPTHLEFKDFPLEQFSDAGKVANEGDPHLKAAADTELYNLEKHAIQSDIDKHNGESTSDDTDDEYTSSNADEHTNENTVSHVQQ